MPTEFMEMRRDMVRDHGERVEIRSLIYLLAKEYPLAMGTRLAGLGRRLLAQAFMKKYALEPLGRPFRKTMDNAIWAVTAAIGNIIYFTGCGTNYLYEDTGRAVVKLLRNMGYCIFIPWGQDCCAIPMLFHDAVDQAMGPSGRISHRPCK